MIHHGVDTQDTDMVLLLDAKEQGEKDKEVTDRVKDDKTLNRLLVDVMDARIPEPSFLHGFKQVSKHNNRSILRYPRIRQGWLCCFSMQINVSGLFFREGNEVEPLSRLWARDRGISD